MAYCPAADKPSVTWPAVYALGFAERVRGEFPPSDTEWESELDASESDLGLESPREIDRRIISALVNARDHLGLRHRVEMARLLGVDESTYNRWEEGTRRVPAWALVRAAEVASEGSEERVSIDALLERPESSGTLNSADLARLNRMEKQLDKLIGEVGGALERRRNHSDQQAAGS